MARHREKKQSIGIVIKEVLMLDLKMKTFIAIINMFKELKL